MTCIINGARTKKELREKLASDPSAVSIEDPSVFRPRYFGADEMTIGQRETVTNHPKRSWFATVTRTAQGFKVA